MKPTLFIHTNNRQLLAAKVSAYAAKSRSRYPEAFDIRILCMEETPELLVTRGQRFRWWDHEEPSIWNPDDPQAFILLRLKVPHLMQFGGRALVLDPDSFAVGDVFDLLSRNMDDKAILCLKRETNPSYFTSVMLLDCSKLLHWQWHQNLQEVFSCVMSLGPWLWLTSELPEKIGCFEKEWNHFDTLNDRTKILHYTNRMTQPWLTGLPFYPDFNSASVSGGTCINHLPNPDFNQERFFFKLLSECVQKNIISRAFLQEQIRMKLLRSDALDLVQAYSAVGIHRGDAEYTG